MDNYQLRKFDAEVKGSQDKIPLSPSERAELLHIGSETKAGDEYLDPFKAMKVDMDPSAKRNPNGR